MDNEKTDVKPEEKTSSDESPEKKDSDVSKDVKTSERAKELLDQKRTVDASRLNELLDKAKLFDAFAPVIDKVKDNPDLLDKALGKPEAKTNDEIRDRVVRLEEERKAEKRAEIEKALVGALERYPDLDEKVVKMANAAQASDKSLTYFDSLRRAYFFYHPEAAQKEAEALAKENANFMGVFSSSQGATAPRAVHHKPEGEYELSEGAKATGARLGYDEKTYAGLMKKHEKHMKARGFFQDGLEISL